ncbi:kinetochore scaffold 1 [Lampris incognitus]|uniref:kinetochore scaffold 1 n=1 Tax=Lampris incognitus TaxID=2546036 RepID=UPI0024B48027|nr:kinetochore scaffold 1 [Lampris incognitus]
MFEQEGRTKHSSWESDDMEITKSQTVAIDAESLHPMYASQNKKRKTNENLSFMTGLTKATRASKEECDMDMTKPLTKLDDGSITVLEFFNLFNLDFVIHNPRQSILPGKVGLSFSNTKDLLKDRYIDHPKQRVYEMDNQFLTEKVEGLKARMKDREKLLRHVNPRLWEEMRSFTEEELKRFGAKLKEKNNFFRKKSKVESHKLKGVLYSNLLRASKNEQQKLRGKLEESDVMLKDLDDCIQHLQAELNAVEGNGLEDSKPTLESAEQGLAAVTKSLADNERQIYELEVQKTCNLDKLKRLKTETQNLENHTDMLHRITEWKFEEKQGNFQVYSFLHKTLVLEVVFEKCDGDEAPERTISDIIFKFSLDERVSPCHAHLVHKLLSQYTEGETAWVKKYPTSKYIPKLLHDVGLVVSRCRLLGEEVRRLKLFGAMSLNILDISCVDTQVRLLFSSLEAFVKFELSVALTAAYPFCVPQVQNYKNHIGNTTVHQIEEIVSSVTPAKNLLTKIVKKINEDLLSGTPR